MVTNIFFLEYYISFVIYFALFFGLGPLKDLTDTHTDNTHELDLSSRSPFFFPSAGQRRRRLPCPRRSRRTRAGRISLPVAAPSCPPPAPPYQRDIARLPLISAPPAPPSTARPPRAAAAALLAGRIGVGGRCFLGVVLQGDGSTAPSSPDLLLPAPWRFQGR